jgi:hypothetical protein
MTNYRYFENQESLSCSSAVLKLGVATLLRVAKVYQACYQAIFYLIIIVLCSILEFDKYFKKGRDTKSLRTPDVADI